MTEPGVAPSADVREMVNRIKAARREGHYYVALLGLRTYGTIPLYRTVRRGLAYAAFERFRRNANLSQQDLSELTEIPERTLARRKEAGKLAPDESDRLLRASRVFGRALELFEGDVELARQWLSTPQTALGGLAPLELAKTDVGAHEVESLLGRLEYGIPA